MSLSACVVHVQHAHVMLPQFSSIIFMSLTIAVDEHNITQEKTLSHSPLCIDNIAHVGGLHTHFWFVNATHVCVCTCRAIQQTTRSTPEQSTYNTQHNSHKIQWKQSRETRCKTRKLHFILMEKKSCKNVFNSFNTGEIWCRARNMEKYKKVNVRHVVGE